MNIIDFHGHFFPDSVAPRAIETVAGLCNGEIVPALDGTYADLIRSMDQNGILATVTLPVATKPEQVTPINESLRRNDPRIIPFGALSPWSQRWREELAFLVDQKIQGIKLHPEYQGFYLNDPEHLPFFKAIADAHLLVLFHAGYDPGPFSRDHALPEMFATLHAQVPHLKIIAGHFGGLLMWDSVEHHLLGLPIWFDTAALCDFLPADQFVRLARAHGIEKVLFGSDTPWEDQGKAIRYIEESSLTAQEKELIFFKNAQRILAHG